MPDSHKIYHRIHGLFPTALGHYKLGRTLHSHELQFILQQPQHKNVGNRISVNDQICNAHALTELREFFSESLSHYVACVHAPSSDAHISISSSWINWSQAGEHHHKHTHANSFISGVFYVQTNSDDKIWFHDDRHKWIQFKNTARTLWNRRSCDHMSLPGYLYLFPSDLSHSVNIVTGNVERVSISFNTWPRGELGNTKNKTRLVLP